MLLYHGSKSRLDVLTPQQASVGEGVEMPEGELLNAIYLTPDLGFAVACAARPDGVTHINDDDRTIEFENPELFNPEQEIFIYTIDTNDLPKEAIREIDERQVAIEGVLELKPSAVQEMRAGEVEKYYELKNWRKEGDIGMMGEDFKPRLRK